MDGYKQSHPSVLTPLLKAWQMSFAPQETPTLVKKPSAPAETHVLHQGISSMFNEADFRPLRSLNPHSVSSIQPSYALGDSSSSTSTSALSQISSPVSAPSVPQQQPMVTRSRVGNSQTKS